jgi:acyl dehydratase
LQKSFSASDVLAFGGACGDWNPVHYQSGYDEKLGEALASWAADPASDGGKMPLPSRGRSGIARFPGPIVHGMLTASLIGTLFASHLPGAIYLSQSIAFKAPVFYEEQVTARIEVTKIEKKNRVTCRTVVEKKNAAGETVIVIEGEAKVMVESLGLQPAATPQQPASAQ